MEASPLVTFGMATLASVVAAAFVLLYVRAIRAQDGNTARAGLRASLIVGGWMALFAALALSGVLALTELRPPPFMLVVLATLVFAVGLALSRVGEAFARGLPLWWLIGAQGFRLPLELVMHQAANEQVMPAEMSYGGYNFDIATGISALGVAALLAKRKAPVWLPWAWNLLGSLLLANILSVAIIATPMLHAFGSEPEHLNTWVFYFPFIWLPTVLVAAALFGHVVVFRALRRQTFSIG